MGKKSGFLLAGSSLAFSQMVASSLPSSNVSANWLKYLNPLNWNWFWFTTLFGSSSSDYLNNTENLQPFVEPQHRKQGRKTLRSKDKGNQTVNTVKAKLGAPPKKAGAQDNGKKNENQGSMKENIERSDDENKKDAEVKRLNLEENVKKGKEGDKKENEPILERNVKEENKDKSAPKDIIDDKKVQNQENKGSKCRKKQKAKDRIKSRIKVIKAGGPENEDVNESSGEHFIEVTEVRGPEDKDVNESSGEHFIEFTEVGGPEDEDVNESSGEHFKEAVKLLKEEYPENFKCDPIKNVYGEYTGDVSVKGDLKLSVNINSLDPKLNGGKKYQAEFFGREFYFKTDKDLFKCVKKHVKYRRKLENYIKKFKEIAATGKFTLKVVKTNEGDPWGHKIVLEIVDWSNLKFKEREGNCVAGVEIVLDHYENEPVVVEHYNAYRYKTPFFVSYNDNVSVMCSNYAFTRPENEKSLYNLFEDLKNSIEDYRKQYVERTKKVFENVFDEIEWKEGKTEGEWEGVFKIKNFSFPVSFCASKGPENYGKICGERFLGNYLPDLKEYNDWVCTFRYLFERCYEKFKMCEKGGNFKVSVNGEKNVIVLESKKGKTIGVPGVLLGKHYSDNVWLDKKDTVAVNKVEFDLVCKKISIYSNEEKEYHYELKNLGAWNLFFCPDAPFRTRFDRFLDHLVSEVEKMRADTGEDNNKELVAGSI